MTPEQINSWAPKPAAGKALVTPQAGIDHPLDAQGMPAPYFQEQGGPRQYYDGLRGRTEESQAGIPLDDEITRFAPPSPFGHNRLADEPPVPMGDEFTATYTQAQRNRSLFGPQSPDNTPGPRPPLFNLPIPGGGLRGAASDVVTPPPENLMRAPSYAAPAGTPDRAMPGRDASGQGQTLGDLLSGAGFRIPTMSPRAPVSGLRGGETPALGDTPVDPREDFRRPPQQAINNFDSRDGALFSGRAPEVADYLRSRGFIIPADRVMRHGNSRRGGHGQGNSIDIRPEDRARVEAEIRLHYPQIPLQVIEVMPGQHFGIGADGRPVIATGHHFHFDLGPAALH